MARGVGGVARSIASGAAVALLSFGLLEGMLRVYNPIDPPQRGWRVVLPVNKRLIFENPKQDSKLPREMVVSYNSLGFRGPEPPADFGAAYTILTMGGSTTHTARQGDGDTWVDFVRREIDSRYENVWLNNAGMEGHSTFGHLYLLEQVVVDLHPDLIVFLVGFNDRARETERNWDATLRVSEASLGERLIARSELLSTALVVYRQLRAKRLGLSHWEFDVRELKVLDVAHEDRAAVLAEHRQRYLPSYHQRLTKIVELCRAAGIDVVLMTHPALFGSGIDPATGRELGNLDAGQISASLSWDVLELYNDVTRAVARENGLFLIDLAHEMPKDSTYFYDWAHITGEGATVTGQIVSRHLLAYLDGRVPERAAAPGAGSR